MEYLASCYVAHQPCRFNASARQVTKLVRLDLSDLDKLLIVFYHYHKFQDIPCLPGCFLNDPLWYADKQA
jgi:hypothetical protein